MGGRGVLLPPAMRLLPFLSCGAAALPSRAVPHSNEHCFSPCSLPRAARSLTHFPKLLPNLQIWEGKEKGGRGSFQRGSQGNLSPELSDSLQWDASTVSLSARAHCRPALRRDSFQGHQQDSEPPHRVEGAARRHRAINPPCRVSGAEGRAVARQYPSAYTPASAAPSEKQRAVHGAFLLPPPLLQG